MTEATGPAASVTRRLLRRLRLLGVRRAAQAAAAPALARHRVTSGHVLAGSLRPRTAGTDLRSDGCERIGGMPRVRSAAIPTAAAAGSLGAPSRRHVGASSPQAAAISPTARSSRRAAAIAAASTSTTSGSSSDARPPASAGCRSAAPATSASRRTWCGTGTGASRIAASAGTNAGESATGPTRRTPVAKSNVNGSCAAATDRGRRAAAR